VLPAAITIASRPLARAGEGSFAGFFIGSVAAAATVVYYVGPSLRDRKPLSAAVSVDDRGGH